VLDVGDSQMQREVPAAARAACSVCECRDGAWRAAQALRSTAGCEPERAVTLSRRRESRHEEKQTEFLESVIEVIAECVGGRRACPRECA